MSAERDPEMEPKQILDDAEGRLRQIARENPLLLVGAGLGIGFLLGGGFLRELFAATAGMFGREALSRLAEEMSHRPADVHGTSHEAVEV